MKTQVTSRQDKEQINESINTNGKYKYILPKENTQKTLGKKHYFGIRIKILFWNWNKEPKNTLGT